ncbi:MAG: hypothetical protein ACREFB_19135 [Stellaceae bacterium]
MITDTHTDDDLLPMLDNAGTWLVRGGLQAPVLALVHTLREALTRAFEEESRAPRSVLVIVKTPADDPAIHLAQMARLWKHLGFVN